MGNNDGPAAIDLATQHQGFEPLLTPRQAGQLLGLHEKTVAALARDGKLPFRRMGKYWKTRESWLDAWVNEGYSLSTTSHGAWTERNS